MTMNDNRKAQVLATYAPAILGIDKSRKREDIMRAMVREYYSAPREFQGNIVTQWQATHEPEAMMDFEMITGLEVTPAGPIQHPKLEWLSAHPHGFAGDDGIVKVRCPFSIRDHEAPVFEKITNMPDKMVAVQVEMFVTERARCFFWQWTPHGNDLQTVEYDPVIVSDALRHLEEFRDEFIAAVTEPEDHLEEPRVTIDTPRAAQMVAEYDDLVEAIEQAELRKKELLAAMVEIAKGKNAIFAGRKLTKTEKKGSISYAQAIKVLAPGANLEPWRGKPSTSWSLK